VSEGGKGEENVKTYSSRVNLLKVIYWRGVSRLTRRVVGGKLRKDDKLLFIFLMIF